MRVWGYDEREEEKHGVHGGGSGLVLDGESE